MPFPKIMPLLTVMTRDPAVRSAALSLRGSEHDVASARSWDRLLRLVRERPVTLVVLDGAAFGGGPEPEVAVADLRRRFPSLATVFVHGPRLDPLTLFRLGRVGIQGLVLARAEGLEHGLGEALGRAASEGTEALVTRAIGGRLPRHDVGVVRLALNGVQLGWRADDLARKAGMTRAHLSVGLRSRGLPSAGHLLTWCKMLHAGRWLGDPGRSAESVSRQLDYSSGAAFRRALRNYLGVTPTELRAKGGLAFVLRSFLDASGLDDSLGSERSVA